MKYFPVLITAVLFLSLYSCTPEEELKPSGFIKAYGEEYSLDYAEVDYAPNPHWGYDLILVKISNRPFNLTENSSLTIPEWNHSVELYLASTPGRKDDFSGSYPLKGFGELTDDDLKDSELSNLTGAVLFLNMRYEDGWWEEGERLFEWTDGHVEVDKTGDVYHVRWWLSHEEHTYTGEYEGPLHFAEAP